MLDLSRMLPGPYATLMLADLGAEVIKVEAPVVGDPIRWSPPRAGSESAVFALLNRNKKSLAVDLKRSEGRELFLRLAGTADVLLEQFRPGVMDRLGLGPEAVRGANPRIVYCSLSGFGQAGPFRERSAHDLTYLALSGALGLITDGAGAPVVPGLQIADLAGGMAAACAILAALLARARTGEGQVIDVSLCEAARALLPIPAAHGIAGHPLAVGEKYGLSGAYPFYNVYETADHRFMALGALEPKFWENFCRAVGRAEWISRQFAEGAGREALFADLRALFASRTRDEWVHLFHDADACCEPVLGPDEALEHPQARARDAAAAAPPYVLSGTPARRAGAAPGLGEHTDAILSELGFDAAARARLREAGVVREARPGDPAPDWRVLPL